MGVLKVNVGTALVPDWRNVGCGGVGSVTTSHTEPFTGAATYPTGPVVTDGIAWVRQAPNYGLSGTGDLFWDGHDFDLSNSPGRVVFPGEGADGTMTVTGARVSGGVYYTGVCWRVSSVAFANALDYYWILRPNGNVHKVIGNGLDATVHLACGVIPDNATISVTTAGDVHSVTVNGVAMGSFTDAFNNTAAGWGVIADNGGGFGTVTSFVLSTSTAATPGRLKLWDGTQWVREACDDDATGSLLFSDDFNRANGPIANGWTATYLGGTVSDSGHVPPGMSITSNQAGPPATYYNGVNFYANLTWRDFALSDIDTTVTWLNGNGELFALRIASDSLSCYTVDKDGIRWRTTTLGDPSFLATLLVDFGVTYGVNFAHNDVCRAVLIGSTLQVYRNGTLLHTQTGITHNPTATRHGIYGGTSSLTRFDDFVAYSVPPTRRPLYVWTGTAWDRVACMVPV